MFLYIMLQKFHSIKIKNVKYNILLCDTLGLITFFREKYTSVQKYINSLTKIMKSFRNQSFHILDFIYEYIVYNNQNKKIIYSIIFNIKCCEIISFSRIIYKNNKGLLSAVVTNTKYRKKGLCYANLLYIIKESNKLFNIKYFILEVNSDNISAIKCYKKIGFTVEKIFKDNNEKIYKMIKVIK